jgi:DNA-binding NarL/FixJ family response regulator
MKTIRIILADDHTICRAGIRSLLQNLEAIEVVAEAGNGREALALAATHHPDVILMDVMMPELNGLEATARVTKQFSDVRVLILSMSANEEIVLQALRAGAAGYLLKNVGPEEFELAIRAVARGEVYLTPAVSKHIINDYLKRVGSPPTMLERLTPRQREVLQLIAEGCSTKEISRKLEISVNTVESHRKQLMATLDIHEVAGLVRYAIEAGLVAVDQQDRLPLGRRNGEA